MSPSTVKIWSTVVAVLVAALIGVGISNWFARLVGISVALTAAHLRGEATEAIDPTVNP
jgi:hypothetical protein